MHKKFFFLVHVPTSLTRNFMSQLLKADSFIIPELYQDSYAYFKFPIRHISPGNVCRKIKQEEGAEMEIRYLSSHLSPCHAFITYRIYVLFIGIIFLQSGECFFLHSYCYFHCLRTGMNKFHISRASLPLGYTYLVKKKK